jgi:hypothetical protein
MIVILHHGQQRVEMNLGRRVGQEEIHQLVRVARTVR